MAQRNSIVTWLAAQPTFGETRALAAADPLAGAAQYAVCMACHGPSGEGNPSLNAPRLAGQQAWYLRREPGWQSAAGLLWGWAWLAFVLLWLHVLWRGGPPRGLGQKVVIVVIVGWLLYLALALYRRSRRAAAC